MIGVDYLLLPLRQEMLTKTHCSQVASKLPSRVRKCSYDLHSRNGYTLSRSVNVGVGGRCTIRSPGRVVYITVTKTGSEG